MALTRRDMLWMAGAGAAGVAGYNIARGQVERTPEPDSDLSPAGRTDDSTFNIIIAVRGGYALVFEGNELTLASVSDGLDCGGMDHPINLYLQLGVPKKADSTFKPEPEGYYSLPKGTVAGFDSTGAPYKKIKKEKHTKPSDLKDPWRPADTGSKTDWNDFVWIPHLGAPKPNWKSLVTRQLAIPGAADPKDAVISVGIPSNPYASRGRWRYQDVPEMQALSDRIILQAQGVGDELVLTVNDGKKLVIKPEGRPGQKVVSLEIRPFHTEKHITFEKNDKLAHFRMFNALAKSIEKCGDGPVPIFADELSVGGGLPTPGDFCPPVVFDV